MMVGNPLLIWGKVENPGNKNELWKREGRSSGSQGTIPIGYKGPSKNNTKANMA